MKLRLAGQFYAFETERNAARPGQPEHKVAWSEIGRAIPEEDAYRRVRDGRSVYTLSRNDALRLAIRVDRKPPKEEIHIPLGGALNPSGRWDVYFPHFHPGDDHTYGHIFFGERGKGPYTSDILAKFFHARD